MAEDTDDTKEPAAADLLGRSHRTPPIVEGEVASSEILNPVEPAASEPVAADHPAAPDVLGPTEDAPEFAATAHAPPETVEAAAEPPADPIFAQPPRARASLWPVAVGLVLGAVIAVAGAFGLSRFAAPPPRDDGALNGRLDALSAQVAAVERKPAPTIDPTNKLDAEITALATRVAAVEAAAKDATSAAGTAQSDAQKALAATSSPPATSEPAAAPVDLGPLQARLTALENRVTPLATALAETKTQIRATEDRDTAAVQQGTRAPALAVAAQSLLRTVEAGTPFASQLAVVEKLGADPGRLAALRPLADKGVPSPADLATRFAPVAAAASKAAEPPPSAGFLEHIQASAARLVQIRKIGGPASTDAPSQVMADLQRGDVAGALTRWENLPEAAKTQSQAFAVAAKARLDALAAAHAIDTDAVAALAKAKG